MLKEQLKSSLKLNKKTMTFLYVQNFVFHKCNFKREFKNFILEILLPQADLAHRSATRFCTKKILGKKNTGATERPNIDFRDRSMFI